MYLFMTGNSLTRARTLAEFISARLTITLLFAGVSATVDLLYLRIPWLIHCILNAAHFQRTLTVKGHLKLCWDVYC